MVFAPIVVVEVQMADTKQTSARYKSMFRGHKIELKNAVWYYSDTNQLCSNRRECGFCGKDDTIEGHDGCVGTLEGVMNACCGHGVTGEAYVQLASGPRLAGQQALDFINRSKLDG